MRAMTAVCGVLLVLCVLACGGGAPRPVVKNPMSMKEFAARRIKEPTTFLLKCQLYRASSESGKDCWVVLMYDPEMTEGVYGHVAKESPIGEMMFDTVKDGKYHYLTATIAFDDSLPNREHVKIVDVRLP